MISCTDKTCNAAWPNEVQVEDLPPWGRPSWTVLAHLVTKSDDALPAP